MSSFGEELRRERELRQISLREVAEATKINLRYLEALEVNDFSDLPGGVFNRGFVRAYAQFIGVDPDAMVNAYLLEDRTQNDDATTDDSDVMRGYRAAIQSRTVAPLESRAAPLHWKRWLIIAAGALVILVGGFLLLRMTRSPVPEPVTTDVRPPSPHPATPSAGGSSTPPVEAPREGEAEPPTEGAPTQAPTEPIRSARKKSPPKLPRPVPDPRGTVTAAARTADDAKPAASAAGSPAHRPPSVANDLAAKPRRTPPPPVVSDAAAASEITIFIDRRVAGRINCDNSQIEVLDGIRPGTKLRLNCASYLIVDASDAGALRISLPGRATISLGPDGQRLSSRYIAVRRAEGSGDSP